MSGKELFEKIVRASDELIIFAFDNLRYIVILLIIFLIGFAAGAMANMTKNIPQKQIAAGENEGTIFANIIPFNQISDEKDSPFDRIKEDNIHVYSDKVVIELKDAEWATFTDTNSMDPVIDFGTNAIEIVPKNESEINVGDIISYKTEYASGTIIHRVLEISYDNDGWFCRTKGDNNSDVDPGKIRFSQIQRLVVAIIY
jgi:hypothetical protein